MNMIIFALILTLVNADNIMNESSGSIFRLFNNATFYGQTQTVNLKIMVDSPTDWLKKIQDKLYDFQVICLKR